MGDLAMVAKVVGAIGQIKAGAAQKAMYDAQAAQTLVQARSNVIKSRGEALKYKQAGVKNLVKMRALLSTVSARAAAGSIDAFSGSTGNLMNVVLDGGFTDYSINKDNTQFAKENMTIIEKSGQHQAAIYRAAGAQAKSNAVMGAFKGLAQAGFEAGKVAVPSPAPVFGGVSNPGDYSRGANYGYF
jgi:hypothetical protein